jgi:hypothetical protein
MTYTITLAYYLHQHILLMHHQKVKRHLSQVEEENLALQRQDRERSLRFEDLHRESGSHLGRMDSTLGGLESDASTEKQAYLDLKQQIREVGRGGFS